MKPVRSTLAAAEQRLDRYVVRMRREGRLMLPAERKLSEELGCSRVLVRKLLGRKDAEGLLVKNHLGRTLSVGAAANQASSGLLTFVAQGEEIVAQPAWNRLWHRVQAHAAEVNLATRLVLYPYRPAGLDWPGLLGGELGVVVAPALPEGLLCELRRRPGQVVVATDEQSAGVTGNLVCLDNYAAGRLAAEELAARGYRRPALICSRHIVAGRLYLPFERRCAGFRDACARLGLAFGDEAEFWLGPPGVRAKIETMRTAAELCRRGFDAVFLHSDEDYDFLFEGLAELGRRVPDDLGVITVNSQDRAGNAEPRLVAVSHASDAVARALVAGIHRLVRSGGRRSSLGEQRLEPSVHAGESLRPVASSRGPAMSRSGPSGRGGFTLVELLVVIAVVAVLASMLLSAVSLVRGAAEQVKCSNNQRQLAQLVLTYSADYESMLPNWTQPGGSNLFWWDKLIAAELLTTKEVYVSLGVNMGSGSGRLTCCPSTGKQTLTFGGGLEIPAATALYTPSSYGVAYRVLGGPSPGDRSVRAAGVAALAPLFVDALMRPTYPWEGNASLVFWSAANFPVLVGGLNSISPRHRGRSVQVFLDGHSEAFRREATAFSEADWFSMYHAP